MIKLLIQSKKSFLRNKFIKIITKAELFVPKLFPNFFSSFLQIIENGFLQSSILGSLLISQHIPFRRKLSEFSLQILIK